VTLLSGAEDAARSVGGDALLSSGNAPALRELTRRRAYLPVPGNVHFFVKDGAGRCGLPRELDVWWLTRGDGESDGVF